MSNLDALEAALANSPKVKQCKLIEQIRTTLDERVAEKVIDAILRVDDKGQYEWSSYNLADLLEDKGGFSVTASSIQRHRRGICGGCPRRTKGN